ncbi:protein of unknown function [Nocardioides terrae]|uniref:DUF1707 domain-containing protein n=1 Tax=Nocardioides terrae TaxID=574651 RepID=A0A1I1DVY4_9ACTN|nr:DUF1707 domain-containing protein [Nocardioides terrae]SFB79095.1 protein of unknown function [Nocardioides terrae]
MSPEDPSQLRISDDDRHKVAEVLREAAGEGRLDLTELDERLEQAYAAKTYADLVPITADLPASPAVARQVTPASAHVPAAGAPAHHSSLAIMSSQDRRGVWRVAPHHVAFASMGSVTLDLRQAIFPGREVVIDASAIMGSVSVIVNAQTLVVVSGTGIMGTFTEGRAKVDPDPVPGSPLVRVRGIALMGSVDVRRRPMPGERTRRLPGR